MEKNACLVPGQNETEIEKENNFIKELRELINRYSKENTSNTPDFVLAHFVVNSLLAFDTAVQVRESFYGRDPRPSMTGTDIKPSKEKLK